MGKTPKIMVDLEFQGLATRYGEGEVGSPQFNFERHSDTWFHCLTQLFVTFWVKWFGLVLATFATIFLAVSQEMTTR